MIPEVEQRSKQEIKDYQEGELQNMLAYLMQHSAFYQKHFEVHAININKIRSLEDLRAIPPTTKEDLQLYGENFLCVPKNKIREFVTTSGTLGEPIAVALTNIDLDRLAYNEAISIAACGAKEGDTIQLMTTMDNRFMAGLAYALGSRKLGCGLIRVGAANPGMQWDSILRFQPKFLIGVPSFILKLISYAENHDIPINETSVESIICIGEPIRLKNYVNNTLADRIQEKWSVKLFSTYASTEMATAFTECGQQRGGHHHPELLIIEVLDENDKIVADGNYGELTITTLGIEGMPLLRYKTGDILKIDSTPCTCGRNTVRLSPVLGRKKQMIKYKGTTIFPVAIQNILNAIPAVDSYVIEIGSDEVGLDDIVIKIAVEKEQSETISLLQESFKSELRAVPQIQIHDQEAIRAIQFPSQNRKPFVVIDKRKNLTHPNEAMSREPN